jgi:AcrR family transcriptional regulator
MGLGGLMAMLQTKSDLGEQISLASGIRYDPYEPIIHRKAAAKARGSRPSQRIRRSTILATIRSLLTKVGCDDVTVRDIAEASGCAVQSIYNLVGPRDQAISDAISEYSLFVGRTATPRADDPKALISIVNRWIYAINAHPEFVRQSNLIFFSDSRSIYYTFRDRQLIGMRQLLDRQRDRGVIVANADIRTLAEHLVLLSSSLFLEWSDRPFPLELLHQKLSSGCSNLLADKLTPHYRAAAAAAWLCEPNAS